MNFLLLARLVIAALLAQLSHASLTSEELFELQAKQGSSGVIQLDSSNFDTIINGPKEYYSALLFTSTDPAINCEYCQKFQPNYENVAASYHASNPGKDAIFFFIVEFGANQKLYSKLKMNAVPKLWVFPPNVTNTASVLSPHFTYSIGAKSLSDILDFAGFISKVTGANIVVSGSFEPTQFAIYFVATFFTVLVLKKKVLSRLGRKKIIENLTTLSIVILTSGYMFTVIRGVPFLARNEKNEVMYLSGGAHWQFGSEIFIISGIYVVLIVLLYVLIAKIPKIENQKKRNVLIICSSFGIYYVSNILTTVFTLKDPSYPYQVSKWL